ncbi:MAG: ROK family protein [Bacteroidales bacterium]|nr:ROK family protein [Bacteroidales bacterium]
MYDNDPRTVVTLDAGGTHFRFTALRGNKPVTETIELPSEARDLDKCMANLAAGFERTIQALPEKPVAISFAFPGPADYPNGIFPARLTNFPAFEGGVALGPYLQRRFNLPVFINNDADLFTYGEALAGTLPDVNRRLHAAGSVKQYRNLVGFILGTGFGIGVTTREQMYIGDNCCSEIYCTPNKLQPELIVEEGVSQRAILHYYNMCANDPRAKDYTDSLDIFLIANGEKEGDCEAARKAFDTFGEVAGYTIAQCVTILDGIIVLGGGLSKSHTLFMPALLRELRAQMSTRSGQTLPRVPSYVYNLEDEAEFEAFARGEQRTIPIYGTGETILCDTQKRLGIITSHIGTSVATTIGAYCYALHQLDSTPQ